MGGKYDSSRTRIVPVFDALMDRDRSGRSWLPVLLTLGSRSSGRVEDLAPGNLIPGHPRWWGKKERRLNPPKDLLCWLIQNLKEPSSERMWGEGETKRKRELLVAGDPKTRAEALLLLEGGYRPRVWYVLEGQSRPDAFLETENLILVIEGKRTEREATTTTTWMYRRSQMLRHMDAAWDIRGNKMMLGMMIVEGAEDSDPLNPSSYWLAQADEQIKVEMLRESLPHRKPAEREAIAEGFLGVTTWQRVCSELNLAWPPAADVNL